MICLLLGSGLSVAAQSLDRFVIAATGTQAQTASNRLAYTVGELAIETGTSGTFTLHEGFHQTNPPYGTAVEAPAPLLHYRLYPNPATDRTVLELESNLPIQLQWHLYDVQGRAVGPPGGSLQLRDPQQVAIDLSQLASGTYYLMLTSAGHQLLETLRLEKR